MLYIPKVKIKHLEIYVNDLTHEKRIHMQVVLCMCVYMCLYTLCANLGPLL